MNMLLEWVRWHFTKPDRLAEEILSGDDPSSHENYWPAVSCTHFFYKHSSGSELL